MKAKTNSPASSKMRQMLENVADGLPYNHHCHGRSEFGGANNTRAALMQRGWLTLDYQITTAGREVIGRTTP
jgi:hypothetical protein